MTRRMRSFRSTRPARLRATAPFSSTGVGCASTWEVSCMARLAAPACLPAALSLSCPLPSCPAGCDECVAECHGVCHHEDEESEEQGEEEGGRRMRRWTARTGAVLAALSRVPGDCCLWVIRPAKAVASGGGWPSMWMELLRRSARVCMCSTPNHGVSPIPLLQSDARVCASDLPQ